MRIPKRLYDNLFPFDEKETKGDFYAFKLFELVVVCYVINFAWQWGFYIQKISDVVLPLGFANYIDVTFMFDHNISLINAGLMSIAVILGFLRVTKFGYSLTLVFFHLHYISRYCLGEISHGSNLIGMAVFVLALAQLFYTDRKMLRVFSLGMIYFYFGFGYTSAGISKLIVTGPAWIDGSHLWLWIGERSVDVTSRSGIFIPNLLQDWIIAHHWFATCVLLFGLLTELTGFLVWFKKTRSWSILGILAMHFGISSSMNILFLENMVILFAVMLPWGRLIDRILVRLKVSTYEN